MNHNIIILFVLLFVLLFLLLFLIGLYIYNKRKWPIKYTLTNTGSVDANVTIYWNDTVMSDLTIIPNHTVSVILDGAKTNNPRTNKPYTRTQTKGITVFLQNDANITFNSSNLPKKYTLVQSLSNTGFNAISTNPGFLWTNKAYYVFSFPNGV